jgi:hypothetical protein
MPAALVNKEIPWSLVVFENLCKDGLRVCWTKGYVGSGAEAGFPISVESVMMSKFQ